MGLRLRAPREKELWRGETSSCASIFASSSSREKVRVELLLSREERILGLLSCADALVFAVVQFCHLWRRAQDAVQEVERCCKQVKGQRSKVAHIVEPLLSATR